MKTFTKSTAMPAIILAAIMTLQLQAMPLEMMQFDAPDGFLQNSKPKGAKRIVRIGKTNSTEGGTSSANLKCGVSAQVGSHTNKYDMCPQECPFFAQNRLDSRHCTFVCAPAEECKKWNPRAPMPDTVKQSRTCRGPTANFCRELSYDGTDSCSVCQTGFKLNEENGQCYFAHWRLVAVLGFVVSVILIIAIVWIVDLCMRPTINGAELEKAMDFRSRSKIMQPKNEHGHRHVYPVLETNLCSDDVAGRGMVLHFNFQALCIFWPLVVALIWCALASFHNELWILGTRKFGTPRHNCILVAWGYETQQRLMWTKCLFLVIVYLFSFITFLLFSIRQHRIYERMNATEHTMKDVALELKGLPQLPGVASVESDIQSAVESATGLKVVGVSVAWVYGQGDEAVDEMNETIMKAIVADYDGLELERQRKGLSPRRDDWFDPTVGLDSMHKKMYEIEKDLLGPEDEDYLLTPEARLKKNNEEDEKMKRKLKDMVTSDTAYVVFQRTSDAEKALASTKDGIKFKHIQEHTLTLSKVDVEPRVVSWKNYGHCSGWDMVNRLLSGFFKVYIPALLIWFFFFYTPYAVAVYNFNYDNGAEPPAYFNLLFTIIVAGGNATMYIVCDICADGVGFRNSDTKACVYTIMYLAACSINIFLDMAVTYVTALKIMIGLGFRTYEGTRLEDIDGFTAQFETYAMQRSLGENSYSYAFPSTFLIPFLAEPVATILLPYWIGRLIIRTHPEIKGGCAEAYIAAFDFDLGRYADLLLNLFLGILIFYFPGGYTWTLFFGMFVSHIYVYAMDHWRVLSVIPTIQLDSYNVDWCAQVCLGACCGLILSAFVFKTNCASNVELYCVGDTTLFISTVSAGVGHFVLHLLLLIYLVPRFGADVPAKADTVFAEIGKTNAYSWFSVNPVHCLRSKLVHKHEPHCCFATTGHEHLLEVNEEIGCYFEDEPADRENYDLGKSASNALGVIGRRLTGK